MSWHTTVSISGALYPTRTRAPRQDAAGLTTDDLLHGLSPRQSEEGVRAEADRLTKLALAVPEDGTDTGRRHYKALAAQREYLIRAWMHHHGGNGQLAEDHDVPARYSRTPGTAGPAT
ncbi:hypothetical protein [Kitasatospora sp. NBC_01300]|uniref:hypothetical protein n=1 Tax=Kitasatospora sp. NBC_01300 TaxID=2903574 RepID=UPI002F9188CC|nr:hypothetical protein OG556_40105 [Kitasatospora sp. NBC_01300]